MSDPNWEPAPVLAGDPADDDGIVIGDLVTTYSAPPDPEKIPFSPLPPAPPAPRRPTRMLAGFFVMDANSTTDPRMVLPADLDRNAFTLRVRVNGTVKDTAFVVISESKSRMTLTGFDGIQKTSGEGDRLFNGDSFVDSDHTGAVWLALGQPLANADTVSVSWHAVVGGSDD